MTLATDAPSRPAAQDRSGADRTNKVAVRDLRFFYGDTMAIKGV